jgi:hypothetical protein
MHAAPGALRPILWAGVFIQPRELEHAFWQSATYRHWSLKNDFLGICFMFINNSFLFVTLSVFPGSSFTAWSQVGCMAWIALATVHYRWMTKRQDTYIRWRTYIIIGHRWVIGRLPIEHTYQFRPCQTLMVTAIIMAHGCHLLVQPVLFSPINWFTQKQLSILKAVVHCANTSCT